MNYQKTLFIRQTSGTDAFAPGAPFLSIIALPKVATENIASGENAARINHEISHARYHDAAILIWYGVIFFISAFGSILGLTVYLIPTDAHQVIFEDGSFERSEFRAYVASSALLFAIFLLLASRLSSMVRTFRFVIFLAYASIYVALISIFTAFFINLGILPEYQMQASQIDAFFENYSYSLSVSAMSLVVSLIGLVVAIMFMRNLEFLADLTAAKINYSSTIRELERNSSPKIKPVYRSIPEAVLQRTIRPSFALRLNALKNTVRRPNSHFWSNALLFSALGAIVLASSFDEPNEFFGNTSRNIILLAVLSAYLVFCALIYWQIVRSTIAMRLNALNRLALASSYLAGLTIGFGSKIVFVYLSPAGFSQETLEFFFLLAGFAVLMVCEAYIFSFPAFDIS